MDFDAVIGLIVLVWLVWSFVRKKKKKKKAAAASAPKQGLLSQVTDRIRLFLKELEKKATEAPRTAEGAKGDASPWDLLAADKGPRHWESDEAAAEDDAPLQRAHAGLKTQGGPASSEKAPSAPLPVVAKPVNAKSAPRPDYLNFAPDNLRNAVVWSEILSPPLALRKDGQ